MDTSSNGHRGAAAIEARGVVKEYGEGSTQVRALRGVDLTVGRGEFVAIMGPSGSGKSTLLHILGALEAPTDGIVAVGGSRYDGLDDKHLTTFRRDHIGFVFQFFNLSVVLGVLASVLPARRAARLDPVQALGYE